MKDILASFIAIMIVMPFFRFFIIYARKTVFKRKGKRAFHLAVNGSTIFYFRCSRLIASDFSTIVYR